MSPIAKLKTVVVGSYNTDLTVSCDHVPTLGESVLAGQFQMHGGGKGANCAVALARAGSRVSFVGAHGWDIFGQMARERLSAESVNIDMFRRLDGVATGVAVSMIEAGSGDYLIAVARSANHQVAPDFVRAAEALIQDADMVFSQLEIPAETVRELSDLCVKWRKPLVLYASPMAKAETFLRSSILLIVLLEKELEYVASTPSRDEGIAKLHAMGCANVVLVDRSKSVTYSDGTAVRRKELEVRKAVDLSGTPECLTVWTATLLAEGKSLEQAVEIAARAMVFCLGRMGGQQSMPFRSDILGGLKNPA